MKSSLYQFRFVDVKTGEVREIHHPVIALSFYKLFQTTLKLFMNSLSCGDALELRISIEKFSSDSLPVESQDSYIFNDL